MDEGTIIQIDDMELDMAAFGRMLQVFSGFGMRMAFVDEEEVLEEPEIVVREPDDDRPRGVRAHRSAFSIEKGE